MIKVKRESCGCVHGMSHGGRETVTLCDAHMREAEERHEAARLSGSHVYRMQQDEQGCGHCGSIEINPACPACNGIERGD
jgi:hypothetical protein